MKRFLLVSLAIIGGLTIVGGIFTVFIALAAAGSTPSVPSKVVLELKLDEPLPEVAGGGPLAGLGEKKMTVRDFVDAMERASTDDRVQGLVAYLGSSPGSAANVEELRDAIKAFRAKGKKAVAYADSYGEFAGGNGTYWLATAFDEVYLQPSGDLGLVGFAAESPFAKDAFAKLGVKPEMGARYEYKNAINMFTETGFTAPHREATEKLLNSYYDQMVQAIAEGRKLSPDQVKTLIDDGPYLAKQALDAKLVDGLLYRDEVYDKVKEGFGKDAELLYVNKYLSRAGRPNQDASKTIALVYGVGEISRGKSSFSPMSGSQSMGSDTVAAALRRAADDDRVKAIVFRVDSPGGSYVASDTIRREVVRAKKKGKPVIVSMGSVAASGGYFVSLDADKIVAQPGTITGSIGVFAGKFVTADLWAKLGVNWDSVSVGKNAALFSTDQDFTEEQFAKVNTELDRIYEDFTSKAAAGRKMPLEKMQQIARGRVWSGADAKELGLVDELGGMPRAIELAKEAAKIGAKEPVRVQVFPKPKTAVEELMAALGGEHEGDNSESEGASVQTDLGPTLKQIRAVYSVSEKLGLTPKAGVLEADLPEIKF